MPRLHSLRASALPALGPFLAGASLCLLLPLAASAQLTVRDLVISGGASAEGYQGNLPVVSVPVLDSTEFVSALVGEVGVRGDAIYRMGSSGNLHLTWDGGLRQFAADGFELRDYAPREWVGTLDLGYARPLWERSALQVRGSFRGRGLEDRPPMPLFLQPGYRSAEGSVGFDHAPDAGTLYDLRITAGQADFLAPEFAPQIRLLDRRGLNVEGGLTLQRAPNSSLRLSTAFQVSHYPKQSTFTPDDPFRRDWTLHATGSWTYQANYLLQLGVEGMANRSNSLRPEYDALVLRGLFSASLPREISFSAYGALTAKRYLHATEFARLLPGEEANSATLAYLSVSRRLSETVDGTLRAGWTRAETEIGSQYFQRFGLSLLFHYRPLL